MRSLRRPACPNLSALKAGNYKHQDNKMALRKSTHDKCMYCESDVTATDYGDVEHIMPKSRYPELEFEWDNLGYSCKKCNNSKSDKIHTESSLINPYDDVPEEHIAFVCAFAICKDGSERGDVTIRFVDLNRTELIERRKERLDRLQKAINAAFRTSDPHLKSEAINALKSEADASREYSLAVECYLNNACNLA